MTGSRSLAEMFLSRVAATPQGPAFTYPVGETWATLTWAETMERVRAISCGLRALGVADEDRCAILSGTRLEWLLADLGILCAGAATTTIYPANTPEECGFVLADSDSVVVFAEDEGQVRKLLGQRQGLTKVRKVVLMDGAAEPGGWVMTLAELETLGREQDRAQPSAFETRVRAIGPERLATLIYTSGTTGRPKGVELLHDCWVFEGEAIAALKILRPDDEQYLWLPLAHSFGKVLQAAQLAVGFHTTVDGRVPKLVENLAITRPTFMAAAPRIFEKVYNRILAGVKDGSRVKQALFGWAMRVGRRVSQAQRARQRIPLGLRLEHALADRLVLSKVRARFGGRLRFFVSGSAPLSAEVAEFFHAVGLLILEGYGLTESSAASFVNLPEDYEFGTVGPPLPGVEVRIAADGEVLIRGRGIMRGYHGMADETAQAKDAEGFLHTGDIGELDARGKLRITDRKKDLIKTSGGKYVAPQALEAKLKSLSPYLSQVVVHGDRRNFCSALVTLDDETLKPWLVARGLEGLSPEARAEHPEVRALVQQAVDELNQTQARYSTIKKFAILPTDFTVESGELTASLKVKRKVIETRYRPVLDGFYTGAMASAD